MHAPFAFPPAWWTSRSVQDLWGSLQPASAFTRRRLASGCDNLDFLLGCVSLFCSAHDSSTRNRSAFSCLLHSAEAAFLLAVVLR